MPISRWALVNLVTQGRMAVTMVGRKEGLPSSSTAMLVGSLTALRGELVKLPRVGLRWLVAGEGLIENS